MNGVVAIVRANLRRTVNDRGNIFFLIVLPLLIVFALGSAIGSSGSDLFVGVVDPAPGASSTAIRERVAANDGVRIFTVDSPQDLRDRVARGEFNAGWVVASEGPRVRINWVAGADQRAFVLRSVLERAVRGVAVDAQLVAALADRRDLTPARAQEVIAALGPATSPVAVRTTFVEQDDGTEPATIRAVLAGGELTLFMFLTSLFGASALLLSRQYGVTRRTRAAPVSNGAIIVGEAASRYIVALVQAAIILVGSALLFGVDWRAPWAVIALCAAMALVGSGVAMLLGTLGRSEQQVGAMALLLGLVMAALGGSMQPLEFFPDTMRTVAFVLTPHAWMNDALWKILVDGAGLAQVWKAIAVLTAAGLALLALAARALARSLR